MDLYYVCVERHALGRVFFLILFVVVYPSLMFFCLWVCFCLSGRNTNSLEAKEAQKAPIPPEFCGTWCAEDRPEIPYEECTKLPKAESTVCILNQSTCHITWKCKSLNCIIWLSTDCSAVSVCFTVVITTYEKHMLINHVKIRSTGILIYECIYCFPT